MVFDIFRLSVLKKKRKKDENWYSLVQTGKLKCIGDWFGTYKQFDNIDHVLYISLAVVSRLHYG